MNTLLNALRKAKIDQYDRKLASEYIDYYGIEPDELGEYANEFVSVCYTFNNETGEHEPRPVDQLPFATVTQISDWETKYEFGGETIIKFDAKKYFESCLQN